MKEMLLELLQSNGHYMHQMIEPIPEDQMAVQPAGIPNHPAWSLGHLALAANLVVGALNGQMMPADALMERFGPGTEPLPDRSLYPSKEELLGLYRTQHERIAEGLKMNFDSVVGQPTRDEAMRAYFPRTDQMIAYMVSIHEANHLGQISVWRHALGYPRIF